VSGQLRQATTGLSRLCSTLELAGVRGEVSVVQHTKGFASASAMLWIHTMGPLQLDGPR
jgi:hypothetical protein